jgi:hypothetical protein
LNIVTNLTQYLQNIHSDIVLDVGYDIVPDMYLIFFRYIYILIYIVPNIVSDIVPDVVPDIIPYIHQICIRCRFQYRSDIGAVHHSVALRAAFVMTRYGSSEHFVSALNFVSVIIIAGATCNEQMKRNGVERVARCTAQSQ